MFYSLPVKKTSVPRPQGWDLKKDYIDKKMQCPDRKEGVFNKGLCIERHHKNRD